ncbi:glutathione S-transferase N-terminal domain-containing protein [Agitococcus lubricus]|uniref:Glutathione S-transferase n=1 Tax=Agitococcus lubricus TaxID=1077255 RepID=A0A2T5IY35_9GAMM|nr:glutathione S-transferase N-terminal domain-containing protein [Agitococcus lubricus]PTQ88883.1 glutathione S-transferase [Agitococcus lubricus]
MKLIASLTSPFARKVRMVLAEKAIPFELVVDIPWHAETQVPLANPLGKVPVLVLPQAQNLYDSRVIVDYLECLVPQPALIPTQPEFYIAVKKVEALADGIADAAATIFIERRRPVNLQSEEWINRQQQKIDLGLAALAQELGEASYMVGTDFSLADIAAICCLGYLDLRFNHLHWRELYPNLATFMLATNSRASVQATVPVL